MYIYLCLKQFLELGLHPALYLQSLGDFFPVILLGRYMPQVGLLRQVLRELYFSWCCRTVSHGYLFGVVEYVEAEAQYPKVVREVV